MSRSLAAGTPEDWIRDLNAELRGMLPFDLLDVVVYKKDENEIEWRSSATGQTAGKDVPLEETILGCVYQHQQLLWIADCDTDEGCGGASQRLKNLELGYRSFCGLPLTTPYRRLGVFGLASLQPDRFTAEDVAFLNQVAGQLALAIDNRLAHVHIADLQNRVAQESVYIEEEIRGETHFQGIVGRSAALRKVLKQLETVAPTNSRVLVLGETGTGKELIARAIHDLRPRRPNAFVKLNCAALPAGLLESELFGHEKGAFTGAIMRKAGRFEVADKGTLFLDEVGDIPLELQPKLLRVLQEHEFERLGSTRTQQVDVRVIAATHRDLKQMVEDGTFRNDLYYRLYVFPLPLPPLRDRREDIPILVRHYVDKYARRMNRRIETIPPHSMEVFANYSWPGNVRELQNFIERAVILTPGSVLRPPIAELKEAAVQTASSELSTL
ncbi:MAG TPA: sigma 54-interacting transcriptional regulator [Candidatus Acidoferrum sp.]|nr:sigma 54-interacting transcriptional regulator [Candidatus Acidoferrum sp.]